MSMPSIMLSVTIYYNIIADYYYYPMLLLCVLTNVEDYIAVTAAYTVLYHPINLYSAVEQHRLHTVF